MKVRVAADGRDRAGLLAKMAALVLALSGGAGCADPAVGSSCGDGVCSASESADSCPADCIGTDGTGGAGGAGVGGSGGSAGAGGAEGCSDVQSPARNPSLGIDRSDNPTGSVHLHRGEFVLRRSDMSIRGRAMDVQFVRTYRSRVERDGPLGVGWDANVFMHLEEQPNGDMHLLDGSGRLDIYQADGDAWLTPAGFYRKLRASDDGWELRDPHGTVHFFDLGGRLSSVRDRNGNQHDYVYDQLGRLETVFDDFGRSVSFEYDQAARLALVRDFSGREIVFDYDAAGMLSEARSPIVTGTVTGNDFPQGRRERYVYDTGRADPALAHNLTEVVAPNEIADGSADPWLVNVYGDGGDAFDKLVSQTVGGSNASGVAAGGTLQLAYECNPRSGAVGAEARTRVTDRRGNVTDYEHDPAGHALRTVEDPDGAPLTTYFTFNAHGELVELVWPLGNRRLYVYDDQSADGFRHGNLLEERRIPDPLRGGLQDEIVTRYTYEPLFNRVATVTAPRGNDTGWIPQNGGANSAERYRTRHFYDYQEAAGNPPDVALWDIDMAGAAFGLGDLNDDGDTTQAQGNLVRIEHPTVTLEPGSEQALAEGDPNQEIVELWRFDVFGQVVEHEDPRGNIDTFAYHPAADPDGDGQDLIAGADNMTGGYLSERVEDAIAGPNRQDTAPLTQISEQYGYDARGNPTSRIDGRGQLHQRRYNALDELIESEAPKVDPAQGTGFLTRLHYDANGNTTRLEVQSWLNDAGVLHPDAAHSWFQHETRYDILDNPIERSVDATRDAAIDPSSEAELLVTQLRYDESENLMSVASPLAVSGADPDNVVVTTYDARDQRVGVTRGAGSPDEATWSYGYDDNGNLVSFTDAEDDDGQAGPETAAIVYDGYNRPVAWIDRAGNERQQQYDPGGRVLDELWFGPADHQSNQPELLRAKHNFYDEMGRRFLVDRELFLPAGTTTLHPIQLEDGALSPGDGLVSEYAQFDANGRRTFHIADDGSPYAMSYDGADRLIRRFGPLSDPSNTFNEIINVWDGNHNLVERARIEVSEGGLLAPATVSELIVYDALDRPVRSTDTSGHTTYVDYDSRGNVVTTWDERGAPIADPLGLYAGTINDRGNPVRHYYDGANRRWLTLRELHQGGMGQAPLDTSNPFVPSGIIATVVEHDANGRIVRRRDAGGIETLYAHDSLNRLVQQLSADGGTLEWTFDRDDQLLGYVDENGSVHTIAHDALGRTVEHTVAPAATTIPNTGLPMLVGTTSRSFGYDGLSRLTFSLDENDPSDPSDNWEVVTVYDSLDRPVEQLQNAQSAAVGAVASSYVDDKRSELIYPSGRVVQRQYDLMDNLVALSDGQTFETTRDVLGCCCPAIRTTFGVLQPAPMAILQIDRQLDADLHVESTTALCPAGLIGQENLVRGPHHTVQQQSLLLQTDPSLTIDVSLNWQLSSLDQVEVHDRARNLSTSGMTNTHLQMSYGPAQEIREISDGNSFLEQRTYDTTYERVDPPWEYDGGQPMGSGLRTRDANYVYQHDALNRLRIVRDAGNPAIIIAEYDYDADPSVVGGRRVRKVVANSGPLDGETIYFHDGARVIEQRAANGDITHQFIHGDQGVDDILVMLFDQNADGDPEQPFFYVRDQNNNVTHVVDGNGTPVEMYTYGVFGTPEIFSWSLNPLPFSPIGNPFAFTGRRFEPETGLYHYRARFYDPQDGEFLSRDPLGAWGDRDNLGNAMSYVGNRFFSRIDPTGLAPPSVVPAPDFGGFRVYDGNRFVANYYPEGHPKHGFKDTRDLKYLVDNQKTIKDIARKLQPKRRPLTKKEELAKIKAVLDSQKGRMGKTFLGRVSDAADMATSGLGCFFTVGKVDFEINGSKQNGFCGSQANFLRDRINEVVLLTHYDIVAIGIGTGYNHVAVGIVDKSQTVKNKKTGKDDVRVVWVLDPYYGTSSTLDDWTKAMTAGWNGYWGGPKISSAFE